MGIGNIAKVDVVVELDIHGAVTFVANHVREPFDVVNGLQVVEAVSLGSHVAFEAIEEVVVAVHADVVVALNMSVRASAVGIAVNDAALWCAVAIVVGNFINLVANLNRHRIWVNANGLLEADTICAVLIEQVAELAACYVLGCDEGTLTALVD